MNFSNCLEKQTTTVIYKTGVSTSLALISTLDFLQPMTSQPNYLQFWVNYQLDAQLRYIISLLLESSTCFEQFCAHHPEYYTRRSINTIRPPDDEHSVARNM